MDLGTAHVPKLGQSKLRGYRGEGRARKRFMTSDARKIWLGTKLALQYRLRRSPGMSVETWCCLVLMLLQASARFSLSRGFSMRVCYSEGPRAGWPECSSRSWIATVLWRNTPAPGARARILSDHGTGNRLSADSSAGLIPSTFLVVGCCFIS